jgi:hypothetical protein
VADLKRDKQLPASLRTLLRHRLSPIDSDFSTVADAGLPVTRTAMAAQTGMTMVAAVPCRGTAVSVQRKDGQNGAQRRLVGMAPRKSRGATWQDTQ